MKLFDSKHCQVIILFWVSITYFYLGYFIERQQFLLVLTLYSLLFFGYIYLIKSNINYQKLFKIGLFFRIIFIVATPFFSQDFYRFIWDGRLINSGINPFQYLPINIIGTIANFDQSGFLMEKMGSLSANHFSNYPPINQLFFAIAGFLASNSILGSIIIFRIIIILADVGIFYFGRKILTHFNQNSNQIFLYFLNPLVIIELSGNLHFEGLMLFFLVLSFYYLIKNNWLLAAVYIAISISVKLLPLLILPLFWQKLGLKKSIWFYFIIISLNLLFFIPFLNQQLINNYLETIALWFTNFEFNASFYYLVRAIGFQLKGYNIIGTVGKITPIITILVILFYSFFKKNISLETLIKNGLIVLTFYFFISTTVHPWYVVNLVLLAVFTNFRYPIVWSFSVILSYYAYSNDLFQENLYLIFIEYVVVIAFLLFESNKNQGLINFNKT